MKRSIFLWGLLIMLPVFCLHTFAQRRAHVYMNNVGGQWDFPVVTDSIDSLTVSSDLTQLQMYVGQKATVPFSIEHIDSLTFEDEPLTETKDPYQVFQLYITTNDGSDVTSRDEYTDCYFALNARGSYTSFSTHAQIRCRGNSSYLWYDKKPYRLKLLEKHKMLGLSKAKSWVLLPNYRDITDIMNTFVFEMGHWVGLPYTNHTRYVELFLNGDYKGVYQLTEQVQQNKNRVNISDEHGILISLDEDDGPELSPYADDNCWSKVYKMPLCVKYPDDEYFTSNTVDSVRTVFAELEQAIKDKDYQRVDQLLDIPSFIKYLQLQEFIYNVELSAPRSIFMHKDGDGKWVMGPLWDFDAGYDFDWSNMYTGHTFFKRYNETVMGTNPLKRNGNYNYVPQFFTDLFGCKEFVAQYKQQWAQTKDSLVSHAWNECMKYVANLRKGAIEREATRWPISGKTFETELHKMHKWLVDRSTFMTQLIADIPEPSDPVTGDKLCGTVDANVTVYWNTGYDQANKIEVDKSQVLQLMGVSEDEFNEAALTIVPLNVDGTEGSNNTNGVFGGWFDADGNPFDWGHGHVYIEVFQDLWNWSCGLHQGNCWEESHTVTMQYQYPHEGTLLKVNVRVTFTIQ